MSKPERLTILGSTGSIGKSTLDVAARHPEKFHIYALCANRNWQALLEQVIKYQPELAVLSDESAAGQLRDAVEERKLNTKVLAGRAALAEVSAEADTVMAAIVGAAGLLPTLAAVKAGNKVLLANKESLVMAGSLFMDAVRQHEALLLPIDSEHNAIFQCLPENMSSLAEAGVRKILLTGSGGPFRETPIQDLSSVTVAQACAHPNWSMGQKISVDSATMMNKGLEYIEARWLFAADPEHIDVILHPQSVVHSMVQYNDGSVLAQLGQPDMRTPIAHAMAWPERIESGVESLDFTCLGELSFSAPDLQRFPCLGLAIEASKAGGSAAACLNAANEEAVEAFLSERIGFIDIARINREVLEQHSVIEVHSIDAVLAVDAQARQSAQQLIRTLAC
ncbi:1-deoxy-D-xylulose-5-phosphate reductoisomerase [uncultured Pseudoteredinibacter sp.]|uniref:1-deoxy-D-xylulose-5-phosphate reductoisomerase n=1 Tax=uncultured Pseudoteredinibacter sp. TaxID=1641701 RepID=UPI002628539F|nr:1-deoxy-D-xylulose-5-phosphate reductoisomerase [uncultured Pseudoteredinibacter sp.]